MADIAYNLSGIFAAALVWLIFWTVSNRLDARTYRLSAEQYKQNLMPKQDGVYQHRLFVWRKWRVACVMPGGYYPPSVALMPVDKNRCNDSIPLSIFNSRYKEIK